MLLFHKNQEASVKVIRLTPPAVMEQFYMRLTPLTTHLFTITANMDMTIIMGKGM